MWRQSNPRLIRHCEERSDEAIQKVVDFRIASSLPLLAMTTSRVKACYKDIAKSVIVSTRVAIASAHIAIASTHIAIVSTHIAIASVHIAIASARIAIANNRFVPKLKE
jgi:hypothetical protein